MRRRLRGSLWTTVCTLLLAGPPALASAQDLTIAAASDLQGVLPQIAQRFERETGRRVRLTFGSSGNFFSQIQNGAPFDVYFSADVDYPRRLEQAGLAEPGTLRPYARGRLVLWTARSSGIDLSRGMEALVDPRVQRISIANPEHAPYGRAAVAAMRAAGIYDQVASRLVLGENISQAGQFALSGNAQVGVIAMSIARTPALTAAGTAVEVPTSLYPPIDQAAVIVRASGHKAAAREFLAYFDRLEVAALMAEYGFTPWTGPPSP